MTERQPNILFLCGLAVQERLCWCSFLPSSHTLMVTHTQILHRIISCYSLLCASAAAERETCTVPLQTADIIEETFPGSANARGIIITVVVVKIELRDYQMKLTPWRQILLEGPPRWEIIKKTLICLHSTTKYCFMCCDRLFNTTINGNSYIDSYTLTGKKTKQWSL